MACIGSASAWITFQKVHKVARHDKSDVLPPPPRSYPPNPSLLLATSAQKSPVLLMLWKRVLKIIRSQALLSFFAV